MAEHALNPTQALLALSQALGIEPEGHGPDEDLSLTLQFAEDLSVVLSAEDDDTVIFARVGELKNNSAAMLETLLSANFFWRDTEGATLSLEPQTRVVLMARRLPENMWRDTAALRQAVDRFAYLLQSWRDVLAEPELVPSDLTADAMSPMERMGHRV